jgi:hypothetical protein
MGARGVSALQIVTQQTSKNRVHNVAITWRERAVSVVAEDFSRRYVAQELPRLAVAQR